MSNEDFTEKLRAHRAHMAAVPEAMATAQARLQCAEQLSPPPSIEIGAKTLRTLVAEVDRLQAALKQAQQDMRDEQREFQREARNIADEARWQERQSRDGDYGSY